MTGVAGHEVRASSFCPLAGHAAKRRRVAGIGTHQPHRGDVDRLDRRGLRDAEPSGRGETRQPLPWLVGGVAVFVLWHVVEALTFLPGASLFFTPAFLLCAGVLGAACAVMRHRTGSLWPTVALHGVVVLLWQALFGGPSAAELMQA